jgi:hypothetical protein
MHFAEFLSKGSLERLRILTPPTCVGLRYGHPDDSLRDYFPAAWFRRIRLSEDWLLFTPQLGGVRICQDSKPTGLNGDDHRPARLPLLRHPIAQTPSRWYRNMNLFPIDYAFRPRLRGRLTLGRLALPRKPWAFGDRVSHPTYRYSYRHSRF